MPTQITLVVLTDKVFDQFFAKRNKAKFMIGTTFPDIRSLAQIDRDITHHKPKSLDEIKELKNDFEAGMEFHNLVDAVREEFFESSGVYSKYKSSWGKSAIKLVEDKLLYKKIKNWNEYISFYDIILPEELNFGIAKPYVKNWHKMLQQYFKKQPDLDSIKAFIEPLFSPKKIELAAKVFAKAQFDSQVHEVINNFYDEFEERLVSKN